MIELRFGLDGSQPCTLEEVGKAFGVTRERIRQIENNTLKKLESLPEAQGLEGLRLTRRRTACGWGVGAAGRPAGAIADLTDSMRTSSSGRS